MSEKFNLVTLHSDLVKEHGDLKELENFRFSNGLGFPDSYKEFVKSFGYGLTLEEYWIYLPMGDYGDSVFVRSAEIKSSYIDDVNNGIMDDWLMAPDGSFEVLKRLYPFACSENGIYLFWDVNNSSNGEFDIFMSDFRGGIGFKKIAKNLYDFVDVMKQGYKLRDDLPFYIRPTNSTFKISNKWEG